MQIAPFVPPVKPPSLKHPPKATAAPPNAPNNPSTYKPSSSDRSSTNQQTQTQTQTQTRPQRHYRCSKCGKTGHNVRRCETPYVWFRQRCGKCGGTGHNARNCPSTTFTTCRVCKGIGRLPCSKCGGRGVDAPPEENRPLSDAQKIMADRIRQRVRRVVGTVGEDGLVLVGKDTAAKRCKRCLGKGSLSCMACCYE